VTKRVVAAAVAGNALEFMDFVTYAFFAVYIGKAFFPAATPLGSLMVSLAVYGAGYVSRPIGSVVIAAYADRVGRKPAMLLSISLMIIGTLGLAATPSYQSIGIAAPVIVVFCRLLQGLALGGELGPSTAFLLEIAPRGSRGIYGSWQLASQGIATLVAGGFGVILATTLTPEALQAWGWRVPFVFGLLLIPVSIYLRHTMPETLAPRGGVGASTESQFTQLRQHSRLITLGILVMAGSTVSTHVGLYMTTYAIATLKMSLPIAVAATIAVGLATLAFSLPGGWLSDRFGRKPVMAIPRALSVILAYPAFIFLIDQRTPFALISVSAILAALTALSGAAALVGVTEMFPRTIRALGLSIGYAVGVALFGGTTQLVITWLIDATGDPSSPGWYVAIANAISFVAILALPTGKGNPGATYKPEYESK
jgi:MFS family permease